MKIIRLRIPKLILNQLQPFVSISSYLDNFLMSPNFAQRSLGEKLINWVPCAYVAHSVLQIFIIDSAQMNPLLHKFPLITPDEIAIREITKREIGI